MFWKVLGSFSYELNPQTFQNAGLYLLDDVHSTLTLDVQLPHKVRTLDEGLGVGV